MNPNQWGVISLIASALVLEGLDIQIMSFAAPAIARDWQVSAPAMGPVIGAALIGTLVGGAFGGYVGDRLGRRPTLIASVVFSRHSPLWRLCRQM
jgi:AAHS family 4-hydroxybenzoate transporter-like MFS transporter